MNFSYNWLCELVEGVDTDARALMRLITLKTAECEGVEDVGAPLAQASPARVVSVEAMGASHNRKAVVETERYGVRTVVCGAPNCRSGLRTVYLPIGKKVIDGVESDGMLASGMELGINRDHTGIVELDGDFSLAPDSVIEVDNKSLTHRPDLWGHHGMAREVAAILGKKLRDPVRMDTIPQGPAPIEVEIEDYALCPRYSALVFENITVQPSPLWLQYRLETIGLNPISNIVDVTNYIMAELPQPMHAFDADKLRGDRIIVRRARPGEKLLALNDETYELDPSALVIADPERAVALAGVIGGLETAIGDSTTRIVLESANFNAACVRKTSSRLKLRTDASIRFEKAQDPANTRRALARAVELFREVSPGIRLVGGLADNWKPAPPAAPIELPLDWLERKLGRAISAEEVRRILESLEFGVAVKSPGVFSVRVPSWRATKDVSIKDDLVEEVGRMVGYASITPTAPLVAAKVPPANEERAFHHDVRAMCAAQGFTEVYNYSFVSDEMAKAFRLNPADHIEVANPIASDQSLLRMSLAPGIWKNIRDNSRHFESFRLFEIGKEIHKRAEGLPDEIPHLAAAMWSRDANDGALAELKRLAECLLPGVRLNMDTPARWFEHPHRKAEVTLGGEALGRLFEFHPKLVETGRAAVLDLDLTVLERLVRREKRYQPLRRFPTSAFDLSVVAAPRERIGDIEDRLRSLAGRDLVSLAFLREYRLEDGRKSVSFRITVGAADRTLSSDEVGAVRARLIDGLRAAGYELRI